MASSKPIIEMLYLTMDENFGKQQSLLIRNIVLYSKEKCTSIMKYTESNVNNKITFSIDTEMSAKQFAEFAADKIKSVNHNLLYGMWFGDKAACLCFHALWNLSDENDWEHRTWLFDSSNDVLVSEQQDDWLPSHDEEGTSVVF